MAFARSPSALFKLLPLLLVVQFARCGTVSIAETLSQCPPFDCSRGSFVTGFFTGQSSDGLIGPELGSPLLTQGTTQPDLSNLLGTGGRASAAASDGQQILSSLSTTTLTECADFCRSYNRDAASGGGELAAYWTLTLSFFADSTSGSTGKSVGKCLCYSPEVCTPSSNAPVFDNSATAAGRSSSVFTLSATGSLCTTGGKGDPHFTGADGSHFDFTGIPNEHFALVSDADLQVNAFFGGRYGAWGDDTHKAMTWMRKVGILWRSHSILLEAREGPDAQNSGGYMKRILVDGSPIIFSEVGESVERIFPNLGSMKITWLLGGEPDGDDLVDKYEVRMGEKLTLVLTLRPEVENLRTIDDGVVHFTLDFVEARLSDDVHGVVGQTYRPDFAGRLKEQTLVWDALLQRHVVPAENGKGFLDGKPSDYMVSQILGSKCRLCRFQAVSDARNRKMLPA